MKKGRIFAVPFREGAWAPVPVTLGQVHWKDRKARKKQVPRKRESERRFIPGVRPPGPIEMKRGRGRTKQSNKWIYHISYDEEFDPGSG